MTQIPKISLNEKWRYRFAAQEESYSDLSLDDSDWEWTRFNEVPIPKLSPPDVIWLRKRFDLNASEACIRYFLRCDNTSYPMNVYLRGELIAQSGDHSFLDVDVTDYVSLDDNLLVLEIRADEWALEPQEDELYLQPIFCDDLD